MTKEEILKDVLEETGGDVQGALYTLEDGEAIKCAGYAPQEAIEEAHAELKKMLK